MIRSLLLQPERHYAEAVERKEVPVGSSYRIAYGEVKTWHIEDSWFCIQWYKSKYMLPYCIEIKATQPLYLPITIIHPDTHWQYMLKGSYGIQREAAVDMILQHGEQHNIYLHLGEFLCYLPVGRHLLVGYTIARSWLQKHNLGSLTDDCPVQSTARAINPPMLSELYYLLSHPKLKGIQLDTNIYASIGRLQRAHDIQQNRLVPKENIIKEKIEAIHHHINLLLESQQIIPTLNEIAPMYRISKHHLAKEHHKIFGMSLAQYIIDAKLTYAASLLAQGCPIKDVSYHLHYHDIPAFSNAFKKKYGVTPSQYLDL